MEWSSLTEAKPFTTVSISWPSWSADLCYGSAVGCLLLVYNGIHVYSCIGVDQNWKFNFMYLFDCFQKIMTEMKIDHWFKICEKNDDRGHTRNIQIKYMIIIIVQYTIAENVPFIFQSHEYCNKNQYQSLTL